MSPRRPEPDWPCLLEDFDLLHLKVDPLRFHRFDFMLDLLEASLPPTFAALDLGTGPGPLAKRIVERFPRARVVLVDHDTSLLKVAEEALRPFGRRVRTVKLDYSKMGWERALPLRRFHAVVTSLALHDLARSQPPTLYRTVCSLLRPGGVFLNSDGVPWDRGKPGIGCLFDRVRKIQVERRSRAPREAFLRELEGWWGPLRRYGPLKEALERRDRAAKTWRPPKAVFDLPSQLASLRRSGFREVDIVWQQLGSASVVLAVK